MEVKCGDIPMGTDGRCPAWGGWLAGVAAADGAMSGEVQRTGSERSGQEEGGQRESSRELVLGLLRKLMEIVVSRDRHR